MTFHRPFLGFIGVLAIAACSRGGAAKSAAADSMRADSIRTDSVRKDSIARARQDSINRAQPGYVIDSVLPVEEELRRFRRAVGGTPVTALSNGSSSREELVKRIVRAVAKRDSADLRAMMLTPREFADLVYPSSLYTHPPYRSAPGLVWMQISQPSESGLRRLLARRGGTAYEYVDHSCKPTPEREGPNTFWNNCQIRVMGPTRETLTQRWFGSIIERGGVYKVVSFSNQF
ncbi:MAG TPA: hypothetical protein VH559_17325 [Gemmatimonadaceae bacterium]|jgi:hypothetical protein